MAVVQHGLITRAQAVAEGMSGAGCDRRVATGAWERMHRGVFRLAGAPRTWEQSLVAVCLAIPSSTASHRAAAALWALPGIDRRLEVTVLEFRRMRPDGVELHLGEHILGILQTPQQWPARLTFAHEEPGARTKPPPVRPTQQRRHPRRCSCMLFFGQKPWPGYLGVQ